MILGKITLSAREVRKLLAEVAAERLGLPHDTYWVRVSATLIDDSEVADLTVTVETKRTADHKEG